MPNTDNVTVAIDALTQAIEGGTYIPSDFKPFVDQHLPMGLAQRARYMNRSAIMDVMSGKGLIKNAMGNNARPPLTDEYKLPARSMLEWSGRNVRSSIPNAFRGELVEEGDAASGQRSPEQPPIILPGDPEWYRRRT
ncbi:MAG: hypothetical protein HYY78_12120 [Betaproteobacteria bacterium]|nr:hypothetical protein [Betaproteobacteria bacterium]